MTLYSENVEKMQKRKMGMSWAKQQSSKKIIFFDEISNGNHEEVRKDVKVRINFSKVRVNLGLWGLAWVKNVKVRVRQ